MQQDPSIPSLNLAPAVQWTLLPMTLPTRLYSRYPMSLKDPAVLAELLSQGARLFSIANPQKLAACHPDNNSQTRTGLGGRQCSAVGMPRDDLASGRLMTLSLTENPGVMSPYHAHLYFPAPAAPGDPNPTHAQLTVHANMLHLHCSRLPRDNDPRTTSVLHLAVPSLAAFTLLWEWMYLQNPALVLQALLPSHHELEDALPDVPVPAYTTNPIDAVAWSLALARVSAHRLLSGLEATYKVWRSIWYLGIHDSALSDTIGLCWQVLIGALRHRLEQDHRLLDASHPWQHFPEELHDDILSHPTFLTTRLFCQWGPDTPPELLSPAPQPQQTGPGYESESESGTGTGSKPGHTKDLQVQVQRIQHVRQWLESQQHQYPRPKSSPCRASAAAAVIAAHQKHIVEQSRTQLHERVHRERQALKQEEEERARQKEERARQEEEERNRQRMAMDALNQAEKKRRARQPRHQQGLNRSSTSPERSLHTRFAGMSLVSGTTHRDRLSTLFARMHLTVSPSDQAKTVHDFRKQNRQSRTSSSSSGSSSIVSSTPPSPPPVHTPRQESPYGFFPRIRDLFQ